MEIYKKIHAAFPKTTSLKELFEVILSSKEKENNTENWQKLQFEQVFWIGNKLEPFKVKIGPYCRVRIKQGDGSFYKSFYVKPTEKVIAYIKNNMFTNERDEIEFELVVFEDNIIRVFSKNNVIIGSRFLAEFKTTELNLKEED